MVSHRYVIGGKISLFLVEKQCRMAKMKIVRLLLFLVLLAGKYQLQSASIEDKTNKCPSSG